MPERSSAPAAPGTHAFAHADPTAAGKTQISSDKLTSYVCLSL